MTDDAPLAGMRIMVVEDDFYLATDEREMLQAAGADVVGPFGTAEEAQNALCEEGVDCAVVDINLGNGPNFTVARDLRERHIPFLFTTGYDAAAIPEEFGDVGRIEKPTNERAMIAALRRMK